MPSLQRYHVASGTYFIAKSSPLIIKASMGTCVGLALYDQENGVGGLIHLLLDKPPSLSGSFNPEKYAQTGLPLFWDALLSAGASPDNLSAWVAGRALAGPVQEYDLAFDIGGKTSENVMAFLASKQIKSVQSETGGFFTCALSLNMRTWECSIEPAGFEQFNARDHFQISTTEDIISSMEKLQPIPQVALKILRLINEDNYDITVLTRRCEKIRFSVLSRLNCVIQLMLQA